MKHISSKLLSILTLCYGGFAIAEQNNTDTFPVLLQYEKTANTDSPLDINAIAEIPSTDNSVDVSANSQTNTPIVINLKQLESSNQKKETPATVSNLASDNNSAMVPPVQPMVTNSTDLSGLSNEIANVLNYNNIEWQGLNNRLQSPDEVRNLYGQLHFQPLWSDGGRVSRMAAQVIRAITDAPSHALRSERYHSEALSSLQAGQPISEPAKFDVIVSDAFITYKSHLANGIIDPKVQFPDWNKEPTFLDFVSIYLNAKSTDNIADIFTVNDYDYRILQKAYLTEKASADKSEFERVPAKTLKPGSKGKAVQILRRRLGLDDSINVYDKELKQAVKEYQQANGLSADGYAGSKTLRTLNRSPKQHLEMLAINMERHRWGYVPNETYLQVNIPAYKMAIRRGNKRLFESNVIVGKTKRPTPIFSDTLETVVLAPYWNVPKTIFNEDKLPKLQKNPNHFGKTMQVINKSTGKVVDASTVDWSTGGQGYRLRQAPGANNALGRMKFLFPNRHAIYLHDTNNRRLFKRSKRAFSSGCIRVERAEDLAIFLLADRNYDRERVQKESRGKEKWLRLPDDKRYPVFLDYYTAWVDANDNIHYSSDIYGHDKQLKVLYKQALNSQ